LRPGCFCGARRSRILAWPVGGWKLEVGAHREQSRREILGPIRVFDRLARHAKKDRTLLVWE